MPRHKRDRADDATLPEGPRIRAHEQLLIDIVGEVPAGRLLCNTAGRGQFVRAYAAAHPGSTAVCWFLDVYQRDQTQQAAEVPEGVEFPCTAELPEGPFDVVVWTMGFRGESELKREMLQEGYFRLVDGGRMIAATDKPEDQWLHAEFKKLFPKVTRRPYNNGVVYLATKTGAPPKRKQFDCEFAFRDGERLIYAYSRPSVFSHRRIDPGARRLISSMDIQPGQKVLDLGCGSGTVGLAALARADGVEVFAVDCNPRALQCAERGAEKNSLSGLTTSLDALGSTVAAEAFDLVLANPPYFSNFRIAELFLAVAQRALRPKGQVLVVTKTPIWFEENMPAYFPRMTLTPVKDYVIARGDHRPRRGR